MGGPDDLTPDGMAEVISGILGRTVRYRQVSVADRQAAMLQRGASGDGAEAPILAGRCSHGTTASLAGRGTGAAAHG